MNKNCHSILAYQVLYQNIRVRFDYIAETNHKHVRPHISLLCAAIENKAPMAHFESFFTLSRLGILPSVWWEPVTMRYRSLDYITLHGKGFLQLLPMLQISWSDPGRCWSNQVRLLKADLKQQIFLWSAFKTEESRQPYCELLTQKGRGFQLLREVPGW